MNVLMLQPRFEEAVVSGRKPHTIRPHRRDGRPRARVGEPLSIRVWTGKPYRSKQHEIAQVVVTEVSECIVGTHAAMVDFVIMDSEPFARADGFADWNELTSWFRSTHGLPFVGVLIRWRLTG